MHSYSITEGYASDPPNQARAELDGSYIAVPWKRYASHLFNKKIKMGYLAYALHFFFFLNTKYF